MCSRKGDSEYYYQQLITNDPEAKTTVRINGPFLGVWLIGSQILKDYFQNQDLHHKKLGLPNLKIPLEDGIFTAEGNVWKKHRRIDSQAFHFNFIKEQVPIIQNIACKHISKLTNDSERNPTLLFQNVRRSDCANFVRRQFT